MREFLLTRLVLFLVIAACVWRPLLTHVPILWPGLAVIVLVGVIALEWHGFAHPHHVRESRRDHGLCLHCGYDPRGNPTDVCPECGTADRAAMNVHDHP